MAQRGATPRPTPAERGRHAVRRRWSGRCVRARSRSTNWSAPSARRRVPVPAQPTRQRRAGQADRRRSQGAEARTTPSGTVASQSIRVNVDTLENLMTMVSELVLTRNQLLDIVRRHDESEFKVPLQRLSNVTAELQDGVMRTRMQPIGNAWQKLPRIVRDLSAELGKEIELEMHGADTELDRQVLELIKDPLTHMVRNSADHGLETRAERIAAGKPEKGTIRLSAYHEGGHIIIEIADDGRGLDIERDQGTRRWPTGSRPRPSSTRCPKRRSRSSSSRPASRPPQTVTSVSGRGVGMDVVRNNIDQIGGTIDVQSVHGQGPELHHQDPADARHRLGADRGSRAASASPSRSSPWSSWCACTASPSIASSASRMPPVLRLRNKLLPLVRLEQPARSSTAASAIPDNGFIVVTQVGAQTFGIVVDGVFHTEEIVVKPMATKLRHIGMFSGNTILGDGSVIMIIDPERRRAGDRHRRSRRRCRRRPTAKPSSAPRPRTRCRCWCSAPARRSRRRCRCRWSRGSKRSTARRSSSRTAATWCSTAASSCRWSASATRSRSSAKARSRCWCSPTAAARWASWSTRSSTSSRTGSTSRSAATRRACSARP